MKNSNQIDGTSYYVLPCGRQIEDFIWYRELNFQMGSALKSRYRMGKKDGEPMEKDGRKIGHYTVYMASHTVEDVAFFDEEVERLHDEAMAWDGDEKKLRPYVMPKRV